jgi:hypothetical protein
MARALAWRPGAQLAPDPGLYLPIPEAGGDDRVTASFPTVATSLPPSPRRARSWVPIGTVTFFTTLYAAGYFIWEQSGWGTQAIRDLVGNIAFMPFNLGVATLFALGCRNAALDPGVRRALRFLALGGLMVFTGNAISAWYVLWLSQSPTVSWADPF